jgi:hypothetical protein
MGGLRHLRAALHSGDLHTMAASVQVLPQQTQHYDINEEGDLIISCELHSGQTPVWANASILMGGLGNGIFRIPEVGTEVMLCSDAGEFEGELYLVACFPTGQTPSNLAPGMLMVISNQVLIQKVGGTPAALPTTQDIVNGVVGVFNEHVHTSAVSGSPTTPPLTQMTSPTGTKVLQAE